MSLDSSSYLNRELSWLEFNQRVLEEAQDPTQPLLERLKFITIVSSNLDEFFEIRVAALKQLVENRSDVHGPDGLRPPKPSPLSAPASSGFSPTSTPFSKILFFLSYPAKEFTYAP